MSGPAKSCWRPGILRGRGLKGFVYVLLVVQVVCGGARGQRIQDVLKGSNGGSSSSELLAEWGCPAKCSCLGDYMKCSGLGLKAVPVTSDYFIKLDLSQNELTDDVYLGIGNRTKFKELNLSKNLLHKIPVFHGLAYLTKLQLTHNQIEVIDAEALRVLPKLKSLDLSKNRITALVADSFPKICNLMNLNLNGNLIKELDQNALASLRHLVDLKINQNQVEAIPLELFRNMRKLKRLDLSVNSITELPYNTFSNLTKLQILRLSNNRLHQLNLGVFHGLEKLQTLELDNNNLSVIQKGGFFNVSALTTISMSNNSISHIAPMAWEFCQRLVNIDLSHNQLISINASAFHCLEKLRDLNLRGNRISIVADGAFNCTSNLEVLDLSKNHLSYTIEDAHGPFKAMSKLQRLDLSSNRIKSINRNAFAGLPDLKWLDLTQNNITSIQSETFVRLISLIDLQLNSTHLLCDCNLLWFHDWLATGVHPQINAFCDYPSSMRGIRIAALGPSSFTCNETPKPRIIDEPPATLLAIKERNLTLTCSATSTSATAMTFKWKREMVELAGANVRNESSIQANTNNSLATSWLTLTNVGNEHAGRYQCVVSNSFGTTYSQKVKISVASFPRFLKLPANLTINSGAGAARLDCAAYGDPQPQIAWQKDGGNHFPAATERRMHVMPSDDAFFIINAKLSDMGVYTCTAENPAGIIKANATLTVLEAPSFVRPMESKEIISGKSGVVECLSTGSPKPSHSWLKDGIPIAITERHFFAGDDQLLVITDASVSDSGTYACTITNDLGQSSGAMQLTVTPAIVANVVNVDEMTGIVIITVVCCAVATSIIWVFIIYHTRKGSGCTNFVTGNTTTASAHDPYNGMAMTTANGELLNQSGPKLAGIYESQSLLPTTHSAMILPMNQRTFNSEYDDLSCKDSGTGDSTKRSHRAASSTHQCTSENDDCCIEIDKTSATVSYKSSTTPTVTPSSDDIEQFPSPSAHSSSAHSIHNHTSATHCSPTSRVNIQTNQLNDLLSRDNHHIAQSPSTVVGSPTASVRSPTTADTSSSLNRSNRSSNSIPSILIR